MPILLRSECLLGVCENRFVNRFCIYFTPYFNLFSHVCFVIPIQAIEAKYKRSKYDGKNTNEFNNVLKVVIRTLFSEK